MYHDVEREPLPFFLREANLKKLSGHLFVSAKDFQITLNLLDGKLANGMSTRFDEKLSVILHLMGTINEEQYNFLSGLHQFSDDQVAGILIDQNFAKKKDIYYARLYQLRRIAISTFALQQGKWIFTAGEPDPPLRETFDIPLAGILVEGARAIDHIAVYAGQWQHSVPVLFKEIPLDCEIYYTDAEREFYAAVQAQEGRSCRELIARLNMVPIEFWRSLLAFHLLGIIEFEKSDAALDLSGDIAALLDLNRQLQAAPGAGAALLGLPPSATAAEFENARAALLARFAPDRFGSGAAPEIKSIARAVCLHLQELTSGRQPLHEAATRPGLWREDETVLREPPPEPVPAQAEEFVIELPTQAGPLERDEGGDTPLPEIRLGELSAEDIVIEPPAEVELVSSREKGGGVPPEEPPGLLGEENLVLDAVEESHPGLLREEDLVVEAVEEVPPGLLLEEDIVAEPPRSETLPGLLSEEDLVLEAATPVPSRPFPGEIQAEEPAPARDDLGEALAGAEDKSEPELLQEADLIVEPEAEPAATGFKAKPSDEEEPLHGAEWIVEAEEESPAAAPPPPAEPETAAPPAPSEFAPVAAPPSLRMASADHEKAWDLLLKAKEFYEKREYVSAVPLLKKAIKLEAGQGDFYYLLGICQSESGLTQNEAEVNLKKAIELKSWSADPVYALGVLYRGLGKVKLAERCFQRVKEIAYEHTGASRALVDLRRQKGGGRYVPPPPKKKR